MILHEYFINGKKHRVDGPAKILYKNNEIYEQIYFLNGKIINDNNI